MGAGPGVGRRCDEGIRAPRERGNILVLFAIVLPLIMVCCAIAVDVGYWWVMGKRAQTAADACALAAAQELPHTYPDVPHCVVAVGDEDFVLVNLPDQSGFDPEPLHLSTRLRSPYDGNAHLVEATVEMRVRTFFGRFVGLASVDVQRRAVAEREPPESHLAVYAHDDDCSSDLKFNGHNINIDGGIHSNGFLGVDGLSFTGGSTTYVACGGTNPDIEPGSSFDSGPTAVAERLARVVHEGAVPLHVRHLRQLVHVLDAGRDDDVRHLLRGRVQDRRRRRHREHHRRREPDLDQRDHVEPDAVRGERGAVLHPAQLVADDGRRRPGLVHVRPHEQDRAERERLRLGGDRLQPLRPHLVQQQGHHGRSSNLLGQVLGLEVSINSSDFNMIGTGEAIGNAVLALDE